MKAQNETDGRLKANRDKKPLSEKQKRQQKFARERWRLQGILGSTHFAEKSLGGLVGTKFEQDFYEVQNALFRIRRSINKELLKQKLQHQVQISKEKADEDEDEHNIGI